MLKVEVTKTGEFYHHYPRVAAVITAQVGTRRNAMIAAWHSPLSFDPPIFGISISPRRFTYQLIVESAQFGVNFLPFEDVGLIASIGGSKGSKIDKFGRFDIATEKSAQLTVPILKGAYAAYECRVLDQRTYGDHVWIAGEIVATHFLQEDFTPEEVIDLGKVRPALYLGAELYTTAAENRVQQVDRHVYGAK